MGDDGCMSLCASLALMPFTMLDMSNVGITGKVMNHLVESLPMITLHELHLSRNRIDDNGAMQIAAFIKKTHSLRILHLRVNEIGDLGAKAIAEALLQNATLTELDLSSNLIGDSCAEPYAVALQGNNTLCKLDMASNKLSDSTGLILAKVLA